MASASVPPSESRATPWRQPQELSPLPDLGPGLDPEACHLARAVIVGRAPLSPAEKATGWQRFRQTLGSIGVGVDPVVAGTADAERLSGLRWHVFGDVARERKLL